MSLPRTARLGGSAALVFIAVVLASPTRSGVRAENGDVLLVSDVLAGEDLADLAYDADNAVFWVLSRLGGKIYKVSGDLGTVITDIPNPHGVGQIPNLILSWGIAYKPSTHSIYVLAVDGGVWSVKEIDAMTGTEVPANAFTLTVPGAAPALRGLAYDPDSDKLWYLDANNDEIVRTGFDGMADVVVDLPGDDPPTTTIRGAGLAVDREEVSPGVFESRVSVAYGDIFRRNPTRTIQLKADGTVTGIEVPLPAIEGTDLWGLESFPLGPQRALAVIAGPDSLVAVERVTPDPVPPSMLTCMLTSANHVAMSWTNHGTGVDGAYLDGEILILRNGVPFTKVPADVTSYVDTSPREGTSDYALQYSDALAGILSPVSFPCPVTVGTGGLVSWTPFAGNKPYDVARNEATGDLFVTDEVGGRIFHYDKDLQLLGELTSPWTRPGPIAFVPTIEIAVINESVVLENVLAVGSTDGVLVTIMTLDGVEKTTIPFDTQTVDPEFGGLTFIPEDKEFAMVEKTENKIVYLDDAGRYVRECLPNDLLTPFPAEMGITFDAIQDTFLVTYEDGTVREVFAEPPAAGQNCRLTRFEFSLLSLGEGFDSVGTFGGMQIADNTLVVCGMKAQALFKVLIFPASLAFRRGDFDLNETIDISDAVGITNYIFGGGAAPICLDAADCNDDGFLDISDPILLLFYLFLGGAAPPAPFEFPGLDPTFRDQLGCGTEA